MKSRMVLIICVFLLLLWNGVNPGGYIFAEEASPRSQETISAQEIIQKNLEACGGIQKIRNVKNLILKGGRSDVMFDPTDEATVYLKKPDLFKEVTGTMVLLCNREKRVYSTGMGEVPLPETNREELDYLVGFYNCCFSLLRWEAYFEKAEFVGKKRYGPYEEFIVRLPAAQGGEDLTAHIDAKTFLLNRVVYHIHHPKAKLLKMVNSLREYKEFDGIKVPTEIFFDKVGWKDSAQQFLIRSVAINPEIEDTVFKDAKVDFGKVECKEGTITGKVQSIRYSILFSNMGHKDMEAAGIKEGDLLTVKVGDKSVNARYEKTLDLSQENTGQEECRFAVHPRAMYPRLILLAAPGVDLKEVLPFQVGDTVTVIKAKAEIITDKE